MIYEKFEYWDEDLLLDFFLNFLINSGLFCYL